MYKIHTATRMLLTAVLLIAAHTGFSQTISDDEIKKNVSTISNPLKKLMLLEPRVFEYDTEKFKELGLKRGSQYGFLTDNVHEVFPTLINSKTVSYMYGKNTYRNKTYYSVDAVSLIPVMVASIQELRNEIDQLKAEINALKK